MSATTTPRAPHHVTMSNTTVEGLPFFYAGCDSCNWYDMRTPENVSTLLRNADAHTAAAALY